MISNTELGVLKEGETFNNSTGSSQLKLNKTRESNRQRAVSTSSTGTGTSGGLNSNSNSRTVDVQVVRRPSDNLLANILMGMEEENEDDQDIIDFQPPNRYIKRDRPVSNDSIATKATELFSFHSSSDSVSKTSNDDEDSDSNVGVSDKFEQHNNKNNIEDTMKTRYMFNNVNNINTAPSSKLSSSPTPNQFMSTTVLNRPIYNDASRIFNSKFNSTTDILSKDHQKINVTPSQRYRLRREHTELSLRQSLKQREKYFDEQNDDSLDEDDIDESFIWNIPMASFSTSSFLTRKKSINQKKNQQIHILPQHSTANIINTTINKSNFDFSIMPLNPVPGIDTTSDLQYIQNTTANLSSLYLQSSSKLSENKFSERANSKDFLPIEFKEASDNGMEDLMLVSDNKLNMLTNSRPFWLPPKDQHEKLLHERQISKTMSIASIEQLDKNKHHDERMKTNSLNSENFVLLLNRGITRNSSLQTLKKIIWETSLSIETRYKIWDKILQSDSRIISKRYIESFNDIMEIFGKMDFPAIKKAEILKLIKDNIKNKLSGKYEISNNLVLLLQLKSISQQGLLPGDELMLHHFILDESFDGSLEKIWDMMNLLQLTCFNDTIREKYDFQMMNKNSTIGNNIANKIDFQNEYNIHCLNFRTWWNILERVDHNLFMWIIDIIIISNSQCFKNTGFSESKLNDKSWDYCKSKYAINNYKILSSLTLDILLNYHFGFNDLASLSAVRDPSFCIPIPLDNILSEVDVDSMFIKKWSSVYKKF